MDGAAKKVLVTGASGFIGSHLCRRLSETGAEVHAVSRNPRPVDGLPVCWSRGDLADTDTVSNLLIRLRPDTIFHLAAHVEGSRRLNLIMPTFRSNLMTTVNILIAASRIPCRRIVFCGSLEEPQPGNPDDPVPSSPYAAAKWASSAYARMCHALYQLPVVILRVGMAYGPRQSDLNKLVPYVTLSLLRGEAPKLTTGDRQADWVYVDDVVDALLAAAEEEGIRGATVDVGSGVLESVRTVASRLVDLIDPALKPRFGAIPDRPLEPAPVADIARSYAMMGWKPKVSLEEGLTRTVQWYRQQLGGLQ